MAQCHLFKCTKCNTELVGPMVDPGVKGPAIGSKFKFGSPVACAQGACRIIKPALEYVGTGDRVPPAPPLPAATPAPGPKVPKKWIPADDGTYTSDLLYSHIPAVPQAALIQELETLFEAHEIPLLGAVFDRFDTYADQLDQNIAPGADPAEKHLTVALVLKRLDAVMEGIGNATVDWSTAVIDRNLDGHSANLTLPSKITVAGSIFRFHLEALNDLVNPRGGHAVLPAAYGPAITKAIAIKAGGTGGEDTRGATDGYYFWSSGQNRGINVVLKSGPSSILTVYYCNAVAGWWNGGLSAQVRADRTV